ncbi:MAG TPA: hypothetical protein VGK99_04845 [Acidobacteriota bacterium]|jgi:hypothetical protein
MKLRLIIFSLVLVNFLSLNAQSVAELAKKDREKREKEGKVIRVIRNEDLKNIQGAKVTHSSTAAPRTEAVVAGPGAPAPSDTVAPPEAGSLDENYWRAAFRDARLKLQLAQNRGLVLELKINDLRNRFFTESDGSTRNLIEQEMNKGREDLEANKLEIKKAEEELAKLEEAAKKVNVPAGWMRGETVPPVATTPAQPAAAPAPKPPQ